MDGYIYHIFIGKNPIFFIFYYFYIGKDSPARKSNNKTQHSGINKSLNGHPNKTNNNADSQSKPRYHHLNFDEFLKGRNTEGTKNAKLKEGRNVEKLLLRGREAC